MACAGHVRAQLFTGKLIARYGKRPVTALGLLMIGAAGVLALMGLDIFHFWGSLILLGVGWNFGFIGATALLTECYRPSERAKVQALNDFLVFGTVAVASFGSGQLLHSAGWNGINIGMLPWWPSCWCCWACTASAGQTPEAAPMFPPSDSYQNRSFIALLAMESSYFTMKSIQAKRYKLYFI
jgi:MFS family permease